MQTMQTDLMAMGIQIIISNRCKTQASQQTPHITISSGHIMQEIIVLRRMVTHMATLPKELLITILVVRTKAMGKTMGR